MYVVFGVSGNTGKVVAEQLLQAGQRVRVVVREKSKAAAFEQRGAEVAVASLDDAHALTDALRGAKGAYLLLPPNFASNNLRADNGRRAQALATAAKETGLPHAVLLSSIGAEQAAGTGPILTVHDAEAEFSKLAGDASFLRAGYFMENWLGSLPAPGNSVLATFLEKARAISMVATRDIGETAAKLLLEGGRGKRVVQLAGPRDLSPLDVGQVVSRLAGRPIEVQQGPIEAMPSVLQSFGMNAEWARLFQEMTAGVNSGHVAWQKEHELVRGHVELESVLAPFVKR